MDLVKYLEEKVWKEIQESQQNSAKEEAQTGKKKKKKKAQSDSDEAAAPVDISTLKPEVYPGDEVRVHLLIKEGNTERIQVVPGMVIRVRGGGQGLNFTVRRIASHGIGVERTFLFNSPRIKEIEVLRHSKVRRAQLYYMRNLRGKKARLKEVRTINRNK